MSRHSLPKGETFTYPCAVPSAADRDEVLAVKRWLRETREAPPKITQAELALRMGVTERTVILAESEKNDQLPRGLQFLRMLQALGVVADAPSAADSPAALLEELGASAEELMRGQMDVLDRLSRIEARLAPPGDERRGRGHS